MNTLRTRRAAGVAYSIVTTAVLMPAPGFANEPDQEPPAHINIQGPLSGNFRGLTTTTGWSLVLRIEVQDSIAILETPEEPTVPVGKREAIVFKDPDGCIDMRHFPIPARERRTRTAAGRTSRSSNSRPSASTTSTSRTGRREISRCGIAWLTTVRAGHPPQQALSPQHGRQHRRRAPAPDGRRLKDGFGYGPDDDLPGLVIMANIGAARAFDENFDRRAGRRDPKHGRLHQQRIAGAAEQPRRFIHHRRMQMIAGMVEPIALVDLDVDAAGVDYLRRLESGPVQAFQFSTPPQNDDDIFFEIVSSYSPFQLELRVVLVEGVAPTFIEDRNQDGRFTSTDLRRMGYKILSNEARIRLVEDFDVVVTQTVTGRTCPPPSLIYRDLDGNGLDGAITC